MYLGHISAISRALFLRIASDARSSSRGAIRSALLTPDDDGGDGGGGGGGGDDNDDDDDDDDDDDNDDDGDDDDDDDSLTGVQQSRRAPLVPQYRFETRSRLRYDYDHVASEVRACSLSPSGEYYGCGCNSAGRRA